MRNRFKEVGYTVSFSVAMPVEQNEEVVRMNVMRVLSDAIVAASREDRGLSAVVGELRVSKPNNPKS